MLAMYHTFRTNTLAVAVKTIIKNLLIWVGLAKGTAILGLGGLGVESL